jgi:hypothetical protein
MRYGKAAWSAPAAPAPPSPARSTPSSSAAATARPAAIACLGCSRSSRSSACPMHCPLVRACGAGVGARGARAAQTGRRGRPGGVALKETFRLRSGNRHDLESASRRHKSSHEHHCSVTAHAWPPGAAPDALTPGGGGLQQARALRVTTMSACDASSGRWMAAPPISYAAAATAASCAARSAALRGAQPARRGRGLSGQRRAAAGLPAHLHRRPQRRPSTQTDGPTRAGLQPSTIFAHSITSPAVPSLLARRAC